MAESKMLAVRLPSDVVNEVRDCAASEGIGVSKLVEGFICSRLTQSFEGKQQKGHLNNEGKHRDAFSLYRQAIKQGEIIPWAEKKMLAVRLPSDLVDAIKDYSVIMEKNISVVVEEFIHLGLAQRKGEQLDEETLARLTKRSRSPFRQRRKQAQLE